MGIKYFNLNPKNNAALIAKLNAVAKFEQRKPHDLGKRILRNYLDGEISKNHLDIKPLTQLADAG